MSTTGGTGNQDKRFGGNGQISLGSIKQFFGGGTKNIRFSRYYRRTDPDISTDQFRKQGRFVPDATENSTVKTGGNNFAFSEFRGVDYNGDGNGDGVIRQYIVEQTNTDSNYNLSAGASTTWNDNLGKNVPKIGKISGRVVSNEQAPNPNLPHIYDHGNDSALIFNGAPYNLDIDINSDATGDPASAGDNSNERGVFGAGGVGHVAGFNGPRVGGTAAYIIQNQTRSGALANGSGIINVNLGNGRILAGGGGGNKGTDGLKGADGADGTVASCSFNSSKNITLHGPDSGGVNFRSLKKCNDTALGCGNAPQNAQYNIGGTNIGGFCTGNQNRKRCRNRKGGNRERGESKCFGHVVKTCNFVHTFSGNSAAGGTGGAPGTAGNGYQGQGAGNIRRNTGGTQGNTGDQGTGSFCSSCDPKPGFVVSASGGNCGSPGEKGNDGNPGQPGGAYGQTAITSPFAPGGAGGVAVYSNTKTSVKVNSASHAKGDLSNVTT